MQIPMNSNMVQSLIRSALISTGAPLVVSGKLTSTSLDDLATHLAGLALVVASIVWSQIHHKNAPVAPIATQTVPHA